MIKQYIPYAKFDCIIPIEGLVHNNVQRLLVTCGVQHYMKGVPMIIFVKPIITKQT